MNAEYERYANYNEISKSMNPPLQRSETNNKEQLQMTTYPYTEDCAILCALLCPGAPSDKYFVPDIYNSFIKWNKKKIRQGKF